MAQLKAAQTHEGVVKYFNAEKGYGYVKSATIVPEGEAWFEARQIVGKATIKKGDAVTFKLSNFGLRPSAVHVVKANDAETQSKIDRIAALNAITEAARKAQAERLARWQAKREASFQPKTPDTRFVFFNSDGTYDIDDKSPDANTTAIIDDLPF